MKNFKKIQSFRSGFVVLILILILVLLPLPVKTIFARDVQNNNNFYKDFFNETLFINSLYGDYIDYIIPDSGNLLNLFENVILSTIPLVEETGGFSFIDNEVLSINGNSLYWNNWYLDGFNISDALFSGSAAIKIPLYLINKIYISDYCDSFLINNDSAIVLNIFQIKDNFINFSNLILKNKISLIRFDFISNIPFDGKNIKWTANIDDLISSLNVPLFLIGPFPVEREPPPPEDRRKIIYKFSFNFTHEFLTNLIYDKNNYNIDFKNNKNGFNTNVINYDKLDKNNINFKNNIAILIKYNIYTDWGKRQFLDFNIDGSFKKLFYESWNYLNLFANEFAIDFKNSNLYNNIFTFEYRYRDKLYAQNHYSENETAKLSSFAFFYGIDIINLINSRKKSVISSIDLIKKNNLKTISNQFKNFNEINSNNYNCNKYENDYKVYKNSLDQNPNTVENFDSNIKFSILIKFYSIKHNDINFVKDIIDPDGEGLSPYYPEGYYYTYNIDFSIYKNLRINNKIESKEFLNRIFDFLNIFRTKFVFDANNRMIFFNPFTNIWENLIKYNNNDYGKIVFYSNSSFDFYGNIKAGIENSFENNFLTFYIKQNFIFSYYINNRFKNSIIFPNYSVNVKFKFFNNYAVSPYLYFGRNPLDINTNLAIVLNPDYFNSYLYVGDQSSGYSLINTTGGRFITIDNNLKQPVVYSLKIGSDFKIFKNWKIKVEGVAKLFENIFWILFKQNSTSAQNYYLNSQDYNSDNNYGVEDGEYIEQNGYNIFYYNILNSNEIRDYLLSNYNEELLGGGKFFNKPFYAGVKLQILGEEKDKWFVNLSFTAYISMAITSFGNGALTNDIGNVDFTQANPNTWINGYGRVDNDRAYIGKLIMGFKLFGFLWNSLNIKYRDGQPFAFYDIYENTMSNGINQVQIIYHTIQAENEIGLKGGPREDSLWNFDYKISIKDFTLKLPVKSKKNTDFKYNKDVNNFNRNSSKKCISFLINFSIIFVNFLDLANELAENVYSNGNRASLELEIPGSIVFELKIKF